MYEPTCYRNLTNIDTQSIVKTLTSNPALARRLSALPLSLFPSLSISLSLSLSLSLSFTLSFSLSFSLSLYLSISLSLSLSAAPARSPRTRKPEGGDFGSRLTSQLALYDASLHVSSWDSVVLPPPAMFTDGAFAYVQCQAQSSYDFVGARSRWPLHTQGSD